MQLFRTGNPTLPKDISEVKAQPFLLPTPQNGTYERHSSRQILATDTGLRPVDVVTHQQFSGSMRKRALDAVDDCHKLQPIHKGDFIVLDLIVSNCPQYEWKFVVAQVIGDVAQVDTADPESLLEFQMFRPATLNKLDSKFVPWIGDTNKPWKGTFLRGHVKAIVDRQVQGKKLTTKSQKLIQNSFL
jgi:hypothetical protein